MDPLRMLLLAAALPLGVAAGAVLLLARLQRLTRAKGGVNESARPAAGPAVVLAFAAAWVVLAGVPAVPPTSRWHWLLLFAVVAGAAGLVETRLGATAKWWVRASYFALLAWVVTGAPSIAWVALPLILMWLGCAAFDSLSAEEDGRPFVASSAIAAAAAAAAIGVSGWAQLASIGGALAAAIGGAGVVALFRSVRFRTASLPATALLVGLLTAATRWSELPVVAALLVGAAPVAAALAAKHRWAARAPIRRLLVSAAATAAVAGAGVAVAVWISPPLEY